MDPLAIWSRINSPRRKVRDAFPGQCPSMAFWIGLFILGAIGGGAHGAEFRTWHYRSNGLEFSAELMGAADGQLILKKEHTDEILHIAPQKLSLFDLQFAYDQLQRRVSHSSAPGQQDAKAEPSAKPESEPASGTCEVIIRGWKQLDENRVKPLTAELQKQLSAIAFPANTHTVLQCRLAYKGSDVGTFRLGRYAYSIRDAEVVCYVDIGQRSGRRERNLHSEKLTLTSFDVLSSPPKMSDVPITREQLSERLLAAMLQKLQQWKIPIDVLTPEEDRHP